MDLAETVQPLQQPRGASTDPDLTASGAASTLFWMLPRAADFVEHATALVNQHRAVAIHLSERTVLGHQGLLERVLARASFDGHDGPAPITLRVHEGSQIDCDIAQHLCVQEDRKHLSPETLAQWHSRQAQSEGGQLPPRTIILRPRQGAACQAAWTYLCNFAAALPHSKGNTRLILLRIDNEPTWPRAVLQPLRDVGQFEAAFFDGALGPQEMSAYLGMRMAIRGSTPGILDVFDFPFNTLARALVAEFAGFDAHFAEWLMRMSESEVLELPQSLNALAARMPVNDRVWRQSSEDAGTFKTVAGMDLVHTLHAWHLACNKGPYREAATRDLQRRKWRAYLTALMPWFEELRHTLIDILRPALQHHLAPTGGQKVRVLVHTGKEIRTSIEDLECGDITAMTREDVPLVGRDAREQAALNLCFRVSRVRNEIAHLRPPKLAEVQILRQALLAVKQTR